MLKDAALFEIDIEECEPTQYAIELATRIVREAKAGSPTSAAGFSGGIRLHWESESGNVRVFCGASLAQGSYIYYERLEGRRVICRGSMDANPENLADRIAWVSGVSQSQGRPEE